MIKTYKYKLYNNEAYLKKYDKWIGICRYVYNVAKEVRDESYKKGVSIVNLCLKQCQIVINSDI